MTTIVAFANEDYAVLAVDSLLERDSSVLAGSKLFQSQNLFFASAGLNRYSPTDFSVPDIVDNVVYNQNAVTEQLQLFERLVKGELKRSLADYKTRFLGDYKENYIGKCVLTTVFAAIENEVPVLACQRFICEEHAEIIDVQTKSTFAKNKKTAWVVGWNSVSRPFANNQPLNFWEQSPITWAFHLIELEIKAGHNKTAYPIVVVKLEGTQITWHCRQQEET